MKSLKWFNKTDEFNCQELKITVIIQIQKNSTLNFLNSFLLYLFNFTSGYGMAVGLR